MIKSVLLILCLSLSLAGDKDVKLKSKPVKENGVTLTNEVILNTEEGFYKRTISSTAPDGKLVVYDVGNTVMSVFDENGKLIREFGKAGQGPGEFNPSPFGGIARIFTTKKYIITQEFMKLMLFTYEGELVREVKKQNGFGLVEVNENSVTYTYPEHRFFETLSTEIDFDGKEIKSITNKLYNKEEASQRFFPNKFMDRLKMPLLMTPYKDGYIQFFIGEYKFQHITSDRKKLTTYSRPYDRKKEFEDPFGKWKKQARGNKQAAAMLSNMSKQYNAYAKGFQSDIRSIAGSYKDYLFVQTSGKSEKEINFDIISPSGDLYTTLTLKGDPTFDAQQGSQPKVENGKLIINYINDEDGPYVKVYDIQIN